MMSVGADRLSRVPVLTATIALTFLGLLIFFMMAYAAGTLQQSLIYAAWQQQVVSTLH